MVKAVAVLVQGTKYPNRAPQPVSTVPLGKAMLLVNVRTVRLDDTPKMAFVQFVRQAKPVIAKILAVVIAKPGTNAFMVVVVNLNT